MSDSLRTHGLQHARLPCPSLAPRVCSNSCPLSRWCYLTVSSSATLFSVFSFCLQSFPSIRVFSNESAVRIRWPKYLTVYWFTAQKSNFYLYILDLCFLLIIFNIIFFNSLTTLCFPFLRIFLLNLLETCSSCSVCSDVECSVWSQAHHYYWIMFVAPSSIPRSATVAGPGLDKPARDCVGRILEKKA